MLVNLFVVMFFLDGNVITYKYAEGMTRFQCDDRAHIEKAKMNTEGMSKVEMFCGTDENFVKRFVK